VTQLDIFFFQTLALFNKLQTKHELAIDGVEKMIKNLQVAEVQA